MKRLIERAYHEAIQDLSEDWSEKEGPGSNPRITECYAAVDGLGNPEMIDDSKTAWCSCYVNKKIQDAGGHGTRSAGARSWLGWGKELKEPEVGCIVIFKRGNSKWQGHVSFVYEIHPTFIRCVGGNQSNDVCLSDYRKSMVLGYRTSKD